MRLNHKQTRDDNAGLDDLTSSPVMASARLAFSSDVPTPPGEHAPCAADKATILLIVLSLLAGRYSLAHVVSATVGLGWAGSIALWLTSLLILACLVIALEHPRYAGDVRTYGAISWCLAAICLHLWMILSALWRDYTLHAVTENVFYLGLSIVITASASWFFTRDRWDAKFDFLCRILFFCACVYAVAGFASGNFVRMSAFGGGPNVFVRLMGIGAASAIHLSIRRRSWRWLVPLPLFAVGALFTGSRGGIVAIVAMLGIFGYYFWFVQRRRLPIVLLVLLGILGLAGLTALWPAFGEFVQQRYVQLTLQQGYLSSRDRLFASSWDLFMRQPYSGVGLDGFTFWHLRTEGYGLYPHNIVLQLAAETGFVGLGMFVALLYGIVRRWFRPKGLMSYTALAMGILFLAASMFSGDFYDARMTWFFLTLYMLPVEHEPPIYVNGPIEN